MMLAALQSYYHRASAMLGAELISPGYAKLGASGELVIDLEGNLIAANPLFQLSGKKKVPLQMIVPLPPKRAGSKPEAAFLYETVSFLFGIFPKPEGAVHRFEASAALHQAVLGDCDDPGAAALLKFFAKRRPGSITYEGVDTSLLENTQIFVVFRLRGEKDFLHQRPAIKKAWEQHNARRSEDSEVAQCMITGEWGPIARLHGNVGGFGADKPTLIGFNQDAFCSFGKYGRQGANAPVGEKAAFEYVTALNMLVKDPAHCFNLAGDKVIFWAERDAPREESLFAELFGGQAQSTQLDSEQRDRIKGVLDSLYKGGNPRDFQLDPTVRFYIMGLASNKTRLVVRFFYENSFGSLVENLMAHYRDIAMVGMRYPYPSVYHILLETAVQQKRENVAPNLESALMRSILDASPYPLTLFQGILRRVRAEGSINALRAGIIKATINRLAGKEELTVALDTTQKDPCYLMGRLFALLERTQETALGEVNASITDKYLNSALATPQMVMPVLLALNTKHMGKSVLSEKKGMLINLRKKIMEVLDMMDLQTDSQGTYVFPATMDANNQGKFLVGYYHQMQSFYKKKENAQPEQANEFSDNQE
jgi:CRISPR-associated protein Csd1